MNPYKFVYPIRPNSSKVIPQTPQTFSQKMHPTVKNINSASFQTIEQMQKTKTMLKEKKSNQTSSIENSNLVNFKSTMKEKLKLNSPVIKILEYSQKINQHFSPVSKPRSFWETNPSKKALNICPAKNADKESLKFVTQIIKKRNYSTKNCSPENKKGFTTTNNQKKQKIDFFSKLKSSSPVRMQISDKCLWMNKNLDGEIKLKMPEEFKHKKEIQDQKTSKLTQQPEMKKLKTQTAKTKETIFENNLSARNVINSLEMEDLDIDFVLSLSAKILTLSINIRNGKDSSSILKQYTEMIQDKTFFNFEMIFDDKNVDNKEIKTSIRQEILSVMFYFYSMIEKIHKLTDIFLEIFEHSFNNSFFILSIIRDFCNKTGKKSIERIIATFLTSVQTENAVFTPDFCFKKIKKNNAFILAKLNKILEEQKFLSISKKVGKIISLFKKTTLEDSVEKIFECFFDILKSKGAMSVLNVENMSQNTLIDQPNFVLQPFSNLSYLPKKIKNYELTLVLDLDETLVHYNQISDSNGEFFIRPDSQNFLIDLSQYYEIVIFTAAVKSYADWIIDRIDLKSSVAHRLYRCSTKQQKGVFIKDLSKIGRDLAKTIIVDNNPENFQYQVENGIFIKSWYNDPNDTALKELAKLLIYVAQHWEKDVRETLKEVREFMKSHTLDELILKK